MARPRRSAKTQDELTGVRILIVEARFYDDIADALLAGATRALDAAGAVYDRITVPGSLEIPAAIAMAVDAAARRRKPYDGAVALGCVIRGDTIHFEIVSPESARALMDLRVESGCRSATASSPSTPTPQAWARARMDEDDKGGDAARAALALVKTQTPPRRALIMADRRTKASEDDARPTGAAPRGLRPCRRSIRWTSRATGLNEILAQFESHWIGREVEGDAISAGRGGVLPRHRARRGGEQRALDPMIDDGARQGWPLKRIEALLRAVLRAGAYELGHRSDVPARVVVSEYVDVAGAFLEKDETGMVNAVLHQLARQLRPAEFDAACFERYFANVNRANGNATGLRKFEDEFQASSLTVRR